MATTAPIAPSTTRTGIDVRLCDGPGPVVSPEWGLGGWLIRFVRLDAGQTHALDQSKGEVYVKVVTGRLTNIDRSAYAAAKVVRSTRVTASEVTAGPKGAIFSVFTKTRAVSATVSSTSQLGYSGPLAEGLTWSTFEEKLRGILSAFDGLDTWLSPGFHLLDAAGEEIAYVWVWIAGKGVDMSTHNHGRAPSPVSPAFAEVHLVLHNGTGNGGMYETPEPGSPHRDRTPLQQGDEHGPFFVFDAASGRPVLRENGAVEYPWHSWQAADDGKPGQAYDVVAAFEITAPYADVNA
jgi:hypothetical protein